VHPELLPLPRRLAGDRIVLRPFERGDGAALYAAVRESETRLRPWMPWVDRHATVDDSEAYCRKAAGWWLTREDLAVAICDHAGALLGGTGLHRFDWELRTFEVGYWIRTSAEGRGYVRESVELLAALAFERLDAARVEIRCDPRNERSAAVPRRLAFVEEGCLRNSGKSPDGTVRDTLVFSLTPVEFRERGWSDANVARVRLSDRDG
jgi:RimJ/RimL family protein N-acetyltransferase